MSASADTVIRNGEIARKHGRFDGVGIADTADSVDTVSARGRELPSEVAVCSCGKRSREWRLRGAAVDVEYTYLSGAAYRQAARSGCLIIAKGPASGWAYETTPLDHGHPWQCVLCHPPASGLDVEYREGGDA